MLAQFSVHQTSSAASGGVTLLKYVCVKPYEAQKPGHLAIDFGDVIMVTQDDGDEYLQGVCKGNSGTVQVVPLCIPVLYKMPLSV